MAITLVLILLLAAFVCCVASALGKCPEWVPLFIVIVILAVEYLPLGARAH